MRLASGAEMREIDRISIEQRGIAGLQLMERAGEAIALSIEEDFDRDVVVVVCGKGNNAGDGLVAARRLARAQWPVRVALLFPPDQFRGDALANWEALKECRFERFDCRAPAELAEAIKGGAIVLDAMLGTGMAGAPREPFDWAIRLLNESGLPIVAADLPSGLADAEETSQDSPGPVIRAVRTITMGLPKIALFTSTGMDCSGAVAVEPLDFPPDLLEGPALWRNLLTLEQIAGALKSRPRRGHKGTFGAAVICGGSEGMSGALMLAGESAMRSGCGLVYLAPPAGLLPIVEARLLEPVKWKLAGARDYLNMRGAESFAGQCQDVQAAALGPGLGRCHETAEAVQYLCERLEKPLVLDADGLNALSGDAGRLLRRKAPTVLTPHPRELSRLWGISVEEIQKSRFARAREFARTFQCHLVLKGTGTVVAAPDGRVFLNPTGNTGLAKGGSGDILTGLIAGLLAQGYDALEASRLGVFLHGLAADIAVKDSSPRALTPSDVIASLGAAWRKLESVQRDFASSARL